MKKLAFLLGISLAIFVSANAAWAIQNFSDAIAVPSIKVGSQGVGGVTFFNGTIVNETTDAGSNDQPVTFGDNVRIDGRVFRGATAGTSDGLPFIVNDNMEIAGALTVTGALTPGSLSGSGIISADNIADSAVSTDKLADSAVTGAKIAGGAVKTSDINDGAVTSAKIASGAVTQALEESSIQEQTVANEDANYATASSIDITTTGGPVLVMYSGYLTADTDEANVRVAVLVDGDVVDRTFRSATVVNSSDLVAVSTQAILDLSAGDHTIDLGWNGTTGSESRMYRETFDVIELKK